MSVQGQWLSDWPGSWFGASGTAPTTQGGYRSLLAFWSGGASAGSTPAAQAGYRSMMAPWVGGASGAAPPAMQAGYRSMMAKWIGGASGSSGTPPAQDGRSGYWRLFYYQLQEAELEREKLKREQKQGQKEEEEKIEGSVKAIPVVSKKPKRSRSELEPIFVPEPLPVFKRKAIYSYPKQFDVAPWLNTLNTEFKAWNLSAQTLHGMLEKQKAANDEEEEILTLLLLAA